MRSTNQFYIPLFLITSLLVACGGDGGSKGGSGDSDSGDIIERLVEQYNRSTNTLLTGGLYEFDVYSDPDYVGSEMGCFDYPSLTREDFLDERTVVSQTANRLCFDDELCYTLADNVILETSPGESQFDLVANDIGHISARIRVIDDVPRAYFYLDVYEARETRGPSSCGYTSEDFAAQFETLNGEYIGRIHYLNPADPLTPLKTEDISLFCSNDACTLGENDLLLSETSSNTFRTSGNGTEYLRGEFASADNSQSYTFLGGASFFGNVIAGFAHIDGDTTTACSTEKECLLLVFTKKN